MQETPGTPARDGGRRHRVTRFTPRGLTGGTGGGSVDHSAPDVLAQVVLCGGGSPVHHEVLNSLSGLHPLETP